MTQCSNRTTSRSKQDLGKIDLRWRGAVRPQGEREQFRRDLPRPTRFGTAPATGGCRSNPSSRAGQRPAAHASREGRPPSSGPARENSWRGTRPQIACRRWAWRRTLLRHSEEVKFSRSAGLPIARRFPANRRIRGTEAPRRGVLLEGLLRRSRGIDLVRGEARRLVPTGRRARRRILKGGKAGRQSHRSADEVRARDQSEGGQDPRPGDSPASLARADQVIE